MDIGKLLAGLGIDKGASENGDLMRQAENMWKMLDDLAENNPDGYQQFVSNNISQGKEALEKERIEEEKAFTRNISKDDFVATLKVDFLLKPKVDQEELKAHSSVVIDKRGSTTYRGSLLMSVFSIKDQKPDLSPSIDKMNFKFDKKNEVCCSFCAAFSPPSAKGLLMAPISEIARRDLSAALSIIKNTLVREARNHITKHKLEIDIDPKLHEFDLLPATLGRLQGYLDCEAKVSPPTSMVLESLLIESKRNKDSKPVAPPQKPEVVLKPPAETPIEQTKKVEEKPRPKIEVISEVINYESMIVEKGCSNGEILIVISLEEVQSMSDVDLDISKQKIRVLKRSPSKYSSFTKVSPL